MLKRIHIHNYKCLVGLELELKETVLLLGSNGSGKTAVLDALFGIRELLSGTVKITDANAFPQWTLTRWNAQRHQVFELDMEIGAECLRYRLKIEHDTDQLQSRIVEETLITVDAVMLFQFALGAVQLYNDDGTVGPCYSANLDESALARVVPQPSNTRLKAFMEAIRTTVICGIRPETMPKHSTAETRTLERYAGNFLDWYRHVVQENPIAAGDHSKALRSVNEGFTNIHLKHSGVAHQSGLDNRALILDFVNRDIGRTSNTGRYNLLFNELSDGQRALVVLYALLHLRQPDSGVVLFLDEPDNHLALREIQPWLMELVELCEDTASQAVICSHHPELIDYLGPDCGLFLRRSDSGITTTRPAAAVATDGSLPLSELIARGWDE